MAIQAEEGARSRRDLPEPPQGPAVQQLSLDGVLVGPQTDLVDLGALLVPATDGEWVEVKTAAIGEVEPRRDRDGERDAHATNLSYFSRTAAVKQCTSDLLVEIERRGTQTAGVVVSVNDGAVWIQGCWISIAGMRCAS